ncbi:hypothetical protein JOE25_005335 [Serratia sp. PL17]|nr:hypothetical protein [Serratia sp. PL17]
MDLKRRVNKLEDEVTALKVEMMKRHSPPAAIGTETLEKMATLLVSSLEPIRAVKRG